MFFLNIFSNYLLPIIYDSMVALLLALFVLSALRIKDPYLRILFFSLPIVKPVFIILESIDVNRFYFQYYKSAVGLCIPDPSNIVRLNENAILPTITASDINHIIFLAMLGTVFIFLMFRWINLALFYRKLAYEEKVTRKDVPDIYGVMDEFTSKTRTVTPDVSLTHKIYISPFVVGLRKFTLVISPGLLDSLSISEKETLIQHELCHIKRKDNLIGWVTLILKDLNFFNPFAYIAYYLIRSEQEKASDLLVVKYSGKSSETVAKDILSSIRKLKMTLGPSSQLIPVVSSTFSFSGILNLKRLENRISAIIKTDVSKIYSRMFPKILMLILFIVLLLFQVVFTFKLGDLIFVLR
ncbi:MAG: hypothetical protein FJW66_01145 [Actinobacteria bacterium]|nr:hypothetical protein [Actinomycetota bacterium]